MKFTLLTYIFITLFLILCDWLIYLILRKNRVYRTINLLHLLIAGTSTLLVTYLYVTQQRVTEWQQYIYAQNMVLFVAALYTAKVAYILWHRLTHHTIQLVKMIPGSRYWTHRMNAGKYPVMTRRKFVSQVGIVLASAPFVSLMMGWSKGRFNFQTRYQKLSFPNLPQEFDGLKVIHISDLHLGSFNSNHQELNEAIEMINMEHPDIICFTGDLVNNFAQETVGWEKVFNRLNARIGKYSILGNHDYGHYSKWNSDAEFQANFNGIVAAHERLGFQLLRNEAVTLKKQDASLAIAGVENWGLPPFPQHGDLKKASAAIDAETPFSILLTHDPDHWTEEVAGKSRFDLSLAGHTHGMQFGFDYMGLNWSPAKYKFKHWAGLYRKGEQYLYVNRGLGVLGLPARVGMPPEITVIELTRGPLGTEPM